ncbi:MAG: endonuclease/exonuclease/phosphatase family protein [Fidelibacterota bacterium]
MLSLLTVAVAQEPLRVVTFNLLGMKPGSQWKNRLQCAIDQLVELAPDIIALQEVNESVETGGRDNTAEAIALALSKMTGEKYRVSMARTHKSWGDIAWEGIAIISRFPVKQRGWKALALGEVPRKVLWNAIETPAGTVNILNTHLAYKEDHNAIREEQVVQILEFATDKLAGVPAWATLLTGDLNATPESSPLQMLTGGIDPFFQDVYLVADNNDEEYTVPAEAPKKRIDYILLAVGSKAIIKESYPVMDRLCSTGGLASDHLGVLAVIEPISK